MGVMWQEYSENKQVVYMKSFVGQQTDLEINSKFYNEGNIAVEHYE